MKTYCLITLIAIYATTASADPRFWRHDRALTSGGGARTVPDLAFAAEATRFVVWQEDDDARGAEIYLTASFDSGCTWCGPVLWATGPGDELAPRVAAGFAPSGNYAVQVVFMRGSLSEVLVAADASISSTASPAVACAAFAALATPAPVSIGGGPFVSRPRIAVASEPGALLHFHATWSSEAGPTERVMYRHDLAGDGSGWLTDPALDLFATLGESGFDPDIAADSLDAGSGTAATIMYRDSTSNLKMTRSADSGASWSAPVIVGNSPVASHSIDSTTSEVGDLGLWNGAAWQMALASSDVRFDAAHWSDPVARDIDFNAMLADHPVGIGAEPALAIGPSLAPFAFPYPLFVFWQTMSLRPEIVSRSGVVTPFDALRPRNLDVFPFEPQRRAPPDPAGGGVIEPHSNCAWTDGWPALVEGVCLAGPRPAGSAAASVSAADALEPTSPVARFATVFSDDRTGTPQIYWKETDDVPPSTPTITETTAECTSGGATAEAELSFVTARSCPAVPERMERYIVYYGSEESDGATPLGPFAHRVELPAAGLTDPAVVRIGGLTPGETYRFALIPEDEARNIAPPDFDPRASDNVMAPAQLASAVMPADCTSSCLVASLSPIAELKAVKASADATFSWSADPSAEEYHLNSVTAKASISEPAAHRPSTGGAAAACTTPATTCTHADAIDDPASPLFYQLFSACGPDGAEEGPL